jgi:hypothetical protein
VDQVDEPWPRLRARQIVELVQHGRQEEPRQERRRDDELHVAEDRVQRRDREREPRDEHDDQHGCRQRHPRGIPAARPEPEREPEDDRGHHREGDHLRRDDGQRHELTGEAHLADQGGVLDQAARAGLQRGGEEGPRRQAAEEKEPVVVEIGRLRLPEDREHDEVDEHQRDRQRERPGQAQQRALVLRPQVAPHEAREELAIP